MAEMVVVHVELEVVVVVVVACGLRMNQTSILGISEALFGLPYYLLDDSSLVLGLMVDSI